MLPDFLSGKEKGMKRLTSFRTKMLVLFIFAIFAVLGGAWLMTKFFLKDYYLNRKLTDLDSCYNVINGQMGEDVVLTPDTELSFEKISSNARLTILVIDPRSMGSEKFVFTNDANEMTIMRCMASIQTYLGLGHDNQLDKYEELRVSSDYSIYQIEDAYMDSRSIDLFGTLDNGCYLFVRTNYQSITEAADIASRFLLITGIIVLFAGSVFLFFLCGAITKPITQMSRVAGRMCRLDFDAKYPVTTRDEVGQLGESLNRLSDRLQTTIGELKQANNELQKDLEHKVEIDNLRTDFLSNVSHELKTPLALIQGYAEGLKENINDDEASRAFYCEVIMDEASKMNKMVQKLLTLNQIEFGQNALEYERFDIVSLLQGILNNTEIIRQQKGVKLHFYENEPIYVWADEYRIEEVATNYISNALNHVAKSKEIAVSVKKNGATVRVSVYNTGEPIPEEELSNIWVKFYKVDKARTREYGGSGIGLSIVKAIMESHNQQYGVINHAAGVEFWFELETAED